MSAARSYLAQSTAPPQPEDETDTNVQEAILQLRELLEKDPNGFANDETTRAILEKLNAEVARLYADADEEDLSDEDDEMSGEEDEEGDAPAHLRPRAAHGSVDVDDAPGGASRLSQQKQVSRGGSTGRSTVRVEMPKGPRPIDLWRAVHEDDRPQKQKTLLTNTEVSEVVKRLHGAARNREQQLLRAQHKRIADELGGYTFKPEISERSRTLAAGLRSIEERAMKLMLKKRSKLDKIRIEKERKEMEEVTFKPAINKAKHTADDAGNVQDRIGRLMQYELERRMRATQRKHMAEAAEQKELTFAPQLNPNSVRIVERMTKEREQAATSVSAGIGSPSAAAAKRAAVAAMSLQLSSGGSAASLAALKPLGRSFLPGHEEETFHPRINPRSHNLHRPGVDDKDVYNRLYGLGLTRAAAGKVRSKSPKARERGRPSTASGARGLDQSHSNSAATELPFTRDSDGNPLDEFGDPAPGHPQYYNLVAYDPSKMSFLLSRLGIISPAT